MDCRTLTPGLLLLAVAGCAHKAELRSSDVASGPFRIGCDDVIEVSVYRDQELTRTVPVRPDGNISLPIAGELKVAGLTTEEIRTEITKRLGTYVKDPTVVTVIVREVHSARFFVTGEVAKPGMYPLHADTTVLQAIAVAGGMGEYSSRDRATVVRAADGDRLVVDIDDPQEAGRIVLHAGDTVVVR